MPDTLRLYLDQCLRVEVAQALRREGFDVVRSAEVGQDRADDFQIIERAISDGRTLVTLDEHFRELGRASTPRALWGHPPENPPGYARERNHYSDPVSQGPPSKRFFKPLGHPLAPKIQMDIHRIARIRIVSTRPCG